MSTKIEEHDDKIMLC